jgi:hypothetical protein
MADLATETTLLLLSPDEWRAFGYLHQDICRSVAALAFLVEPWLDGGPPPTAADLRRDVPTQSSGACPRALEPLVAAGQVEQQRASSRVGRIFQAGQGKSWRVVDRAGRQGVADRVAASLGATTPPPARDATLAVLLWAGRTWESTGLDGPLPRPWVEGPDPRPWGPLGTRARDLSSGAVVPDAVTDPGVLPLLARALSLGDRVTHLE